MIKHFIPLTSLLLAATVSSAPAEDAPPQDPALLAAHPAWLLTTWTSEGVRSEMGKHVITLSFADGGARGNAGINSYSGSVKATRKGSLKLGPLAMTEMAGDPALMKMEDHYLKLLGAMTHFVVQEDSLVLSDGTEANRLHFVPKPRAEQAPLVGTTWLLTAFEETSGETVSATALVEGTRIDLIVGEEGRASGSAGVNRYFGPAKVGAEGAIEFGNMASTRRAGPPEAMKQEQRFLTALASMCRHEVTGTRLALSNADGTRRLLFEAAQP